ncbi:phage holin family protein [Aquimarina sp. W85]|uniref:phage holin family protein n=1 Tax=Aquimarina rhodophyticola TaxID=3342246 RepID=UPI0036730582
MRFLVKIILSALAVMVLAEILPGVAVVNYISAILVALVLAILNAVLRSILIVLTLPVTILTLGLFLLIINSAIILIADHFVGGFNVEGWLWALIFSILLSIFQSVLYSLLNKE